MSEVSPEFVLALIGVPIAIYSALSDQRRLSLRFRMRRFDWGLAIAGGLIVHLLLFDPVISAMGLGGFLGPWRLGFTPQLAAYAAGFICVFVIAARIRSARLDRRNLPIFVDLLDEVAADGDYVQISRMLRSQLGALAALAHESSGDSETKRQASELSRRLLSNTRFVKAVSTVRSDLAVSILALDLPGAQDFEGPWIAELLSNSSSELYYELNTCPEPDHSGLVEITNDHRILCFYLSDPSVAWSREVYQYFGEWFIRDMARRSRDAVDRYNYPLGRFYEEDSSGSPYVVVFRFFDLMVCRAYSSGIEWHMWLYYYPHFLSAILENIAPVDEVDLDLEWPTPYHYLIYRLIDDLRRWVRIGSGARGRGRSVPVTSSLSHDNGHIPKSAALAIGQCMVAISSSDCLTPRFKSYVFGMGLSLLRELNDEGLSDYALLVARVLRQGWDFGDGQYTAFADQEFDAADTHFRIELEDLWDRAREVGRGAGPG